MEISAVKYNGTTVIAGLYHAEYIQQTAQIDFVFFKLKWGG